MNRILLAACLLTTTSAFALDDTETTRKSFGAPSQLEVRNVNGLIRVTAANSPNVQLVATRKIHADDQQSLTAARDEVKLDIQESGGHLRICVIHRWEDCKGNVDRDRADRRRGPDYQARYDLELQIPARTEIDIRSVNGPVEVTGVQAPFRVDTVNGKTTLEEMDGAGSVKAVNGSIKLSFANVPTSPISAKTVNGTIEAAFPKSLNAALRFKTFRGEVFTDFTTTLPAGTTVRRNREFTVNVGSGGPTHSFETLNGRIQIAQR